MTLSLPSYAVRRVTGVSTYEVALHDELLLVTPQAGGTTVELYDGAVDKGTGKAITIRNEGTARITLTASTGNVEGGASYNIEPTQSVTVKSDGTDWLVTSNDDLTHQVIDTSANGVLTVDWRLGKNHAVTLTEPVTVTFVGGKAGGHYVLVAWQDGTGGHGITWPGDIAYSGNIAPDPAETAGAVDVFAFYYDGDTYIMAGSLYTVV